MPVVTITPQNHGVPTKCNGQWDHHDHIFECLRVVLPQLDQSLSVDVQVAAAGAAQVRHACRGCAASVPAGCRR